MVEVTQTFLQCTHIMNPIKLETVSKH